MRRSGSLLGSLPTLVEIGSQRAQVGFPLGSPFRLGLFALHCFLFFSRFDSGHRQFLKLCNGALPRLRFFNRLPLAARQGSVISSCARLAAHTL